MEHLSMATKRELINRQKKAYQHSSKQGKCSILDSLVLSTELSRDHLIRMLNSKDSSAKSSVAPGRGRKPIYTLEHKRLLLKVWELLNYPSSRRLKESLPDALDNLQEHQHISLTPDFRQQMIQIAHGTIDRLLRHDRKRLRPWGLSTTKPGSLLKSQIPIRRGSDWDDSQVGFVEIDLVAHCGSTTRGEYVNTLDVTDVCSGWTECRAIRNKARSHTLAAMQAIQNRLPFELLGVDSDNGSEFINDHFLYWAREQDLVFTRGRPNHKNDSCYVEQKNWSIVRHAIGYKRYEGQEVVDYMNQFYDLLRLINNYFMPSQKLLSRQRIGGRIVKTHDRATTPFRRLIQNPDVEESVKAKLHQEFKSIDLVTIRTDMDKLLAKIHTLGLG